MADVIVNSFKGRLLGDSAQISSPIDPALDTIKMMLLTSSYTPDIDADVFIDDVSANEISASGSYSAGGVTLTVTSSTDDTNDLGAFDAADVAITSATITARYAVIYKDTGTASTSPILCVLDFGADKTSTEGTFTVAFNASGIITLS